MNLKHIEKTHTLQLDQSDCGVACLMSIIQFYEGTNSIEKLRELSGTSKQGTTMLGLYQVANQLGFTAEGCEADIQALIDHKQPVILHVFIENKLQHYLVCYHYDATKGFLIGDPGKGIYYWDGTKWTGLGQVNFTNIYNSVIKPMNILLNDVNTYAYPGSPFTAPGSPKLRLFDCDYGAGDFIIINKS